MVSPIPTEHRQVAPASLRANRPFVRYWLASAGSSFAYQMLSVAVGWHVYAITGRAFDLGLIGFVQFVPSFLLALPAGHAADRYPRKRVVVVAQACACGAIVALTALTMAGRVDERAILALVFVLGIAMAFEFPAQRALLPQLVSDDVLPRAMAMNSSGDQAATIVGPALGGLLYVFGPAVVYAVAATLFLASAALLLSVPDRRTRPATREPTTVATIFAGVTFIRANRDVLGVMSLDLFAVLLGGATALLPIFARDVLHTGPVGLGLLRAAPAAGALLMSLWLARHSIATKVGPTMFAAVAGFGTATIVFGLSTSLWLSLVALFALGACDMVSVVIRSALVQLETPDAMRGRVSGVHAIFVNTSNQLGEFESGLLASWVGAVPAVLVGGIGTLAVVALWMRWFPTLRRRQTLRTEAAS